jgi:hypothetical protein
MKRSVFTLATLWLGFVPMYGCNEGSSDERSLVKDLAISEVTPDGIAFKAVIHKDDQSGLVFLSVCDVDTVFMHPELCRSEGRTVAGTEGITPNAYLAGLLELVPDLSTKLRLGEDYDLKLLYESHLKILSDLYLDLARENADLASIIANIDKLQVILNTLKSQKDPDLEVAMDRYEKELENQNALKIALEAKIDDLARNMASQEALHGSVDSLKNKISEHQKAIETAIMNALNPSIKLVDSNGKSYIGNLEIFTANTEIFERIKAVFASKLICPKNYLMARKNPAVGVDKDFCIAKFEAKSDGTGKALSIPESAPWVTSVEKAMSACSMNGSGFALISNAEWQASAREIENQGMNWSGHERGQGRINRGHSDGSPNSTVAATADDIDGCHGTNESCTGNGWNDQKRTHVLGGGEIIWDFAGNIDEWVSDERHFKVDRTQAIFEISDDKLKAMFGPLGTYADNSGLGAMLKGDDNISGIRRGGDFDDGIATNGQDSGIFSTELNFNRTDESIGFRCVFRGN